MAAEKNGFDLSNSQIAVERILSGGPPRDGIPAIDNPQFVSAAKAGFLQPQDRVLAIDYKGVKRAYPIRILNWHEIVNDSIQGESVVVTFCPLCGTGVVYSGEINGVSHQFGVSGLLYNSDVLLYDRRTESLWSQILSKAISGKMAGHELKMMPVRHTSWQAWRKTHPDTQVLSIDTGYSRDYSRSPYAGYESSENIYFPINAKSSRYHPKERVLGLQIGRQFKAYPFAELAKTGQSSLKDSFAGQLVTIEFDVANRDGQIIAANGEPLNTINSFWFAWYAFHPQTKVFQWNNSD